MSKKRCPRRRRRTRTRKHRWLKRHRCTGQLLARPGGGSALAQQWRRAEQQRWVGRNAPLLRASKLRLHRVVLLVCWRWVSQLTPLPSVAREGGHLDVICLLAPSPHGSFHADTQRQVESRRLPLQASHLVTEFKKRQTNQRPLGGLSSWRPLCDPTGTSEKDRLLQRPAVAPDGLPKHSASGLPEAERTQRIPPD